MDLHRDGAATTDQTRHYANIVSLLETCLSEQGGPYVLVIWTEHPQHRDELTQYLDKALPPDKPFLHPLAVLALAKTTFISLATGATQDAPALRKAVIDAVQANPQLAALLTWEGDVLTAAGETLAALQSLVPLASRSSGAFPSALDSILSLLAREAVGRHNVKDDPRAAINGVLVPILADRILNAGSGNETHELWKNAITRADDNNLSNAAPTDAASINRMLHLALPEGEKILPDSWGAVVVYPENCWTNQEVARRFDVDRDQLLTREFKVKPEKVGQCRPRLIRSGAVCDHAQKRLGPITYIFALEIPLDGRARGYNSPGAEWKSPILVTPDSKEPFYLVANARFSLSLVRDAYADVTVCYRLREQLLMQLITHVSEYNGRPGIISMPT
jgi:hypothetical protein